MNKFTFIILIGISFLITSAVSPSATQPKAASIKLVFHHTANAKALVFGDSNYINKFGEQYQLTRLKYYISNISFGKPVKNMQLIDAAGQNSIIINVPPGNYNHFSFMLGVDSLLNCSGAQSGALDPLKGMFWTWNSGYIFFKLEGNSPSSTADLHRIEYHIGGYKYPNKVSATLTFALAKSLIVKENITPTIDINVNLDKFWQGTNELSIAENALIMVPGDLAKKAGENFAGMFSLRN